MSDTPKEEITPDQLLDTFRGGSMKRIILFTVVVHVVVLVGTSFPYLWKLVAGEDTSKLSEKERMELAAHEARSSLREIAGKHGLKPEDLGNRFAGNAPAAPKEETEKPAAETPAEPEPPKSEIEKEINTKEAGPALPAVGDEKEDLFK